MAVTFKMNANYGVKLAELFGVPAPLLVLATSEGVTITQATPGVFTVVDKSGYECGSITIKGQWITMVKAGTLGPTAKKTIQSQFVELLQKAVGAAVGAASSDTNNPSVVAKVASVFKDSTSTKVVPDASITSLETSKKYPPTTSKKYPQLGDGIPGTTLSSVYRVVALSSLGYTVAIRFSSGVLSVRVVSSAWDFSSVDSVLSSLCFKAVKSSKGLQFRSCHYSCCTPELAKKTLGAVFGALGFHTLNLWDGLNGEFV